MKPIRLLLFACLILPVVGLQAQEDFRKTAPQPGPAPEINIGDYESFQLDNGLTVIVVEDHKLPRLSVQISIDVPPHREGDKAGLASLAGGLLDAGTTQRSKAEIDEAVDFIGASLSSTSGGLFGASLSKHRDALLEIMSEVLLQPAFPADEFDKSKTQINSGLAAIETDPNAMMGNLLPVLRYGAEHPYGEVITRESLEAITLDDVKGYYQTYFRPNIAYLVLVGDLDRTEARSLAETYFGAWEEKEVPRPAIDMPEAPARTKVSVVDLPSAVQSVVAVTYPVDYRPGNPMAVSGSLMNSVLGGGFSARLMQNLREDKGYTYGIRSSLSSDRYVGYFTTQASVRNEVTDSAITQILAELEGMQTRPVDADELRRTRNQRIGAFGRSLESPQTIASFALNTIRYDLPDDYYATYLQRLNAVDPEAITAAAEKYIRPGGAHIAVVGKYEEIAEKLLPFDDDGTIDLYDAFGRPVAAPGDAPADVTGEQVIQDYLAAIGGRERLQALESVHTRMSASIQGQPIELNVYQQPPDKFTSRTSVNGMVMQEDKYDGQRAVRVAMGQKQELQGAERASLAQQANPVPEFLYLSEDYDLEVKGTVEINGERAVQIEVTNPENQTTTEFYGLDSKFKLRNIQTQQAQGQTLTITSDMADYQEVDGIFFPHTITISGAMPFPLAMTVEEIKVNEQIDEEVFRIE